MGNTVVPTDINCQMCKKILLLSFKCKCNYYYCLKHRYSDKHNCTFDYKKYNKEQLIKSNPIINKKQLESI